MHSVELIAEAVTRHSVNNPPNNDQADSEARLGSFFSKLICADFILGGIGMFETSLVIIVCAIAFVAVSRWKRRRARRQEMLSHAITPEILHDLLETDRKPIVLDLRLPLDFLAHTEMIPGAHRIAPSEIIANPDMISRDCDYVLYCTCPGEASSETVLATALKLGFLRVKMLAGGLEAWKQRGYPVEAYTRSFHLDVQ